MPLHPYDKAANQNMCDIQDVMAERLEKGIWCAGKDLGLKMTPDMYETFTGYFERRAVFICLGT